MQLALAADFRIATPDCELSVMESKWGLIPDMTGTVTLRELVPMDVAKELAMTGRRFDAVEAKTLHLVTQVAEQPEEEEEEGEAKEVDPEAARKKKMMCNRKARLVGYRNLAKAAGYLDKYPDDVVGSAGLDGQACLLSLADAKRCTRFVPATPGATTYGLDEFSKRHELFKKSMPDGAAWESQVNLDLVLRAALNDATVRAMEAGRKTISASMMQSVLRGPAQNMLFTSVVPPVGLVR